MARRAARGFWSRVRALSRSARRWLDCTLAPAFILLVGLTCALPCRAEAVNGEAAFSAEKGYARLVFKLAGDVKSEVVTAGSIVVIRFEQPVDVNVDRLAEASLRQWRVNGFGPWAAIEKATGAWIGRMEFPSCRRQVACREESGTTMRPLRDD